MIKGSVLALRSQVSSRKLLQRALTEGGSTRTQFDQLVSEKLYQALSTQSFTYATPIQSMSYPAVRSGNDVVIGAETGSGKTLAYLMPIIDEILSMADPPVLDFPLGFILTPNKELCNQVEQMAQGLVNTLKEHGSNIRIGTNPLVCMVLHIPCNSLHISVVLQKHRRSWRMGGAVCLERRRIL